MTDRDRGLYAAFKAKDARFDGRFFVGIKSTGIYCRPVCRARQPKAENCTFFTTAAEAEQAGACAWYINNGRGGHTCPEGGKDDRRKLRHRPESGGNSPIPGMHQPPSAPRLYGGISCTACPVSSDMPAASGKKHADRYNASGDWCGNGGRVRQSPQVQRRI